MAEGTDGDDKTSGECGLSKVLYDRTNKLLVLQWLDNKVVSCTSTLGVSGLVPVNRRSGSQILNLTVERALKCYQEGMDGVDRGDQYRECGGGFAKKAHYKKWYKKAYFAVLDFMLLNGFFAWNMSAKEDPNLERMKVKKSAFYAAVVEEMIVFTKDDAWVDDKACPTVVLNDHILVPAVALDRRRCIVCSMEEGWRRKAGLKDV